MKTNIKLREYRKKRNLTAEQLASALGVSIATYYKYENGERKLTADTLCKIAKVLDVSVDVLLGLSPDADLEIRSFATRHYKSISLDILKYLICDWNGSFDDMVQLLACYCSLPTEQRKDVVEHCLFMFIHALPDCDAELVKMINVQKCNEIVEKLK